ncbi:MAG: hypothetical protein JXR69_04095 [Candidatus Delongbacteria bacterium]|nr:hypothetical protein [Candidatus Delongbacteria bacterium]
MEINEKFIPYWMKGTDNSVALYSSIKCVRNYKDRNFPAGKKQFNNSDSVKLTDDILSEKISDGTVKKIDLEQLSINELVMMQKVRILPNLRISELKKLTIYTYDNGQVFLLLNYMDHLTFYSYGQGGMIKKAYSNLKKFLKLFDIKYFAVDEKKRFLTSSIEYFGTGMKCFSVLTLAGLRVKNKFPEIISYLSQNSYSNKKYFGFGSSLDDLIIIMNKDSLTLTENKIVENHYNFLKLLSEETKLNSLTNNELNDIYIKTKRIMSAELLSFKSFMEAYNLITLLVGYNKIKKIRISELNKTLSILIINLPRVIHSARVKRKLIENLIRKLD